MIGSANCILWRGAILYNISKYFLKEKFIFYVGKWFFFSTLEQQYISREGKISLWS